MNLSSFAEIVNLGNSIASNFFYATNTITALSSASATSICETRYAYSLTYYILSTPFPPTSTVVVTSMPSNILIQQNTTGYDTVSELAIVRTLLILLMAASR